MKKVTVAIAALAAVGFAGSAMAAGPATKAVNVSITVQPFIDISMSSPSIANEITNGSSDFGGTAVAFTVTANKTYNLWAAPNEYLTINGGPNNGKVFGKASNSGTDIGYFLILKNSAGTWIAGLSTAVGDATPKTVTGDGTTADTYVSGSLGSTLYHIAATGRATDTPNGAVAAPGTYTGTATIVATLN